jgi:hypothetical protein
VQALKKIKRYQENPQLYNTTRIEVKWKSRKQIKNNKKLTNKPTYIWNYKRQWVDNHTNLRGLEK